MWSMSRIVLSSVVVAALAAGAVASAGAAEPEGIIKYRKAVMKGQAGHMGAIAGILRGEVEFEDALGWNADALAASTRDLTRLFPEGSGEGDTNALPAIWDDRAAFEKAADEARMAGADLAEAVRSGGDVTAAFKAMGQACKGCHDDFREDD